MSLRWLLWMSSAVALALPVGTAAAQTLGEEQASAEEPAEDPPEGSGRLDDEQAEVSDEAERERAHSTTDPFEEENLDYFFLGAFYRHVIIPSFIQGLFVDGGIDASNPATGITFNYRKNQFNVSANVWWNNAVGQGYFRAQGDPRTDTELIEANMGVIFVTAEFLWGFPITDWFAFEVGFDLGFGFIYGGLTRTEAYETFNPDGTPRGDFQPCTGPDQPGTSGYCESPPAPNPCYANNGGHYNCTEPNWLTEGGDVPVIFPWVSLPHIALRFKPIHQVQIRIDGGYGLYNFFFGGSVSYGF